MFCSGFVSIIGKPNVGKSTLLNSIIGEKISIVTSKPQTTRNRIIGIKNLEKAQIVFLDTPGIFNPKHKLGEIIVKKAINSIKDIDIIYFVVNPEKPQSADKTIMEIIKKSNSTSILLINKIDLIMKENLLPIIAEYINMHTFDEIFQISAIKGEGIDKLLNSTTAYLPEGPRYYPDDIVSNQPERFMASEIIREKIMKHTLQEVPHATAVEIIRWKEVKDRVIYINANIYVEKESQKGIIIGKNGAMLKRIGIEARKEIAGILNARIYLQLYVKVKKNWRKDSNALRELGFR